jgi:hypothetical protein
MLIRENITVSLGLLQVLVNWDSLPVGTKAVLMPFFLGPFTSHAFWPLEMWSSQISLSHSIGNAIRIYRQGRGVRRLTRQFQTPSDQNGSSFVREPRGPMAMNNGFPSWALLPARRHHVRDLPTTAIMRHRFAARLWIVPVQRKWKMGERSIIELIKCGGDWQDVHWEVDA